MEITRVHPYHNATCDVRRHDFSWCNKPAIFQYGDQYLCRTHKEAMETSGRRPLGINRKGIWGQDDRDAKAYATG